MSAKGKLVDRKKVWSAKAKRDLEAAFDTINPCSEKDWTLIVDVLKGKWKIDEVKAQAKKMRLKQIPVVKVPKTPETGTINKQLRSLVPKGKIPNKGTIRREVLENEIMQHLFVRRDENEVDATAEDSDDFEDKFINEVMRDHALDESFNESLGKLKPLPKRTFFPRSVSSSRSVESQEDIGSVGDDFSMPDRRLGSKYKFQYRANQLSRSFGKKLKKVDET
ncbi:hypothetical protein M3Y97_00095400 [Aphelenchoides bicaudatus]|nr:hypothetical protein M3Y97_00095400 [Aphelenchoides bicaudatus]